MKKLALIIALFLALGNLLLIAPVPAQAGDKVIIRPLYPELENDPSYPPGSAVNPYIIEDEKGRRIGTMRPQFEDPTRGDGFMEPGTGNNPYVIEGDEYYQ